MVDQQQVDNLKYKVSNVSESQLDDSKGKLQIKRINFMQDANHPDQTPGFTQIMLPETQQDDNGFFDMDSGVKRKKDSALSLSEHDANSPAA